MSPNLMKFIGQAPYHPFKSCIQPMLGGGFVDNQKDLALISNWLVADAATGAYSLYGQRVSRKPPRGGFRFPPLGTPPQTTKVAPLETAFVPLVFLYLCVPFSRRQVLINKQRVCIIKCRPFVIKFILRIRLLGFRVSHGL